MSRTQISKHYTRLATLWPADRLRPEVQFQSLLKERVQNAPAGAARDEHREINAAYNLLDNAFRKQHTLSEKMMTPASNPSYYKDLGKDIEEAPDRTWFTAFKKRMSNMIRWS